MTRWVLLRGLTREAGHWGHFPALLGSEPGGAPPALLDLPGNGRLNADVSPASVEAMAAHCRAALRRQGLPPPYRLLAMSLGAMVAVAWARSAPGEIAAAVLINTSLRPFSPPWQRLRPPSALALLRLAGAWSSSDPAAMRRVEATVLRLTSAAARTDADAEALLAEWVALRAQRPVSASNAWRQLGAAACFRAPSSRPPVRMHLLAGAGDTLVDPRCSQALARAWQVDLAVHPTAGHDLPLDDAAWVLDQLRKAC